MRVTAISQNRINRQQVSASNHSRNQNPAFGSKLALAPRERPILEVLADPVEKDKGRIADVFKGVIPADKMDDFTFLLHRLQHILQPDKPKRGLVSIGPSDDGTSIEIGTHFSSDIGEYAKTIDARQSMDDITHGVLRFVAEVREKYIDHLPDFLVDKELPAGAQP